MLKGLLKFDLGEIGRQTIKGGLYGYMGVLIGFVTTAIIFPRFLTTAQIGVLTLLISYSQLISVFGSLGFASAITRFFPYFKNDKNGHNGLSALAFLVVILGYSLSAIVFYLIEPLVVAQNEENSLYFKFSWLVFPLAFFTLLFNMYDTYNRANGNAVTGAFTKEVIQRLLVIASALAFAFLPFIDFPEFIYLYVFSMCSSAGVILWYLLSKRQLSYRLNTRFLRKGFRRILISVSLYSILEGLGSVLVQRVDTIMLSFYLSISETGIYTTTFFFGILILLPARALTRITSKYIAQSIKDKDLKRVKSIYKKSSMNQLILSALIFIGLWANIDNCFHILTEEFEKGKYVIFFIGLSNIVNSTTGISSQIIGVSKYYRANTYLLVIFIGLVVSSNVLFIPRFGITGAAIASFTSVCLYNLLRVGYVYKKMKILPFDAKQILVILIASVVYFLSTLLPTLDHFVLDILVRSLLITVIYIPLILAFRTSDEANSIFKQFIRKAGN